MFKYFLIFAIIVGSITLSSCTRQVQDNENPSVMVRVDPKVALLGTTCHDGQSLVLQLPDAKPLAQVSNMAYSKAYMEIWKDGRFLTKVVRDLKATIVVGNYTVLLRDRKTDEILFKTNIVTYI